jgi:hypothetical protein
VAAPEADHHAIPHAIVAKVGFLHFWALRGEYGRRLFDPDLKEIGPDHSIAGRRNFDSRVLNGRRGVEADA